MYPLPEGVRSALYVNLLTEDNLPYYTHTILGKSPEEHPLNEWSHRWTAEEQRHSNHIRNWITVTQALDPILVEDGRMVQVGKGEVPIPATFTDMIAYVSLQELATQVAHRNTGRKLGNELLGSTVMARVAGDETKHHVFYRDLTRAAIDIDPSTLVVSIVKQLRSFHMPGTGIPGFSAHEKAINQSGIFGPPEFYEDVVVPTLEHWDLGYR